MGEGLGSCSMEELQQIEQQLEKSVSVVRARKNQVYKNQIEQLKEKPQPQAKPAAKDHQIQRENQPYAESSPSSDVVTELFIGLHRSN
ncbi:hypothetical protein TSUD_160020 [Trifolium subterraneum]|uniref:K-box domain-containing protein n=1 Tax=Trifolium subterraneum TaxID=3900 RepID=A0A2Z6NEM2_TRISU|nr:hypothetical protein TSUD_160020 [Trifolium subterraneum]